MAVEEGTSTVEGRSEETAETAEAATTLAVRYPVAPGVRLKVRSGPGTQYQLIKVLPLGANVPINCQKPGEWVTGTYGTTNLWDNIANGQYVSDAYVHTGSDGYVAPRCA
ncbi:peptidase [Streptomyces aurantiacus]|uniref:peptidase n=1 Tax=Streptomyces aurantiacus TaxID=47760 RepID=UPI0006E17E56|nr:peptidase [Streptomyces aurantiacus]